MRIIGWIVGIPIGLLAAGGVFWFFGPFPLTELRWVILPILMLGASVTGSIVRSMNRLADLSERRHKEPLLDDHETSAPRCQPDARSSLGSLTHNAVESSLTRSDADTAPRASIGTIHDGVLTLTRAQLDQLERNESAFDNVIVATAVAFSLIPDSETKKVFVLLGTGSASMIYADGSDSIAFEPSDLRLSMGRLRIPGLSDTVTVDSVWGHCLMRAWQAATLDEFIVSFCEQECPTNPLHVLIIHHFVRGRQLPFLRWRLPAENLRDAVRRLRAAPKDWEKTRSAILTGELRQEFCALMNASDFPEAADAASDIQRTIQQEREFQQTSKRGCASVCGWAIGLYFLLAMLCSFLAMLTEGC